MNEKVLNTLEYHKIIDALTAKCATPLGKEEAAALSPMAERESIEKAQQETEDALTRILRFGPFTASGARDIRESLLRLNVQANLSIPELMNISALLKAAQRVRTYGREKEAESLSDSLSESFSMIEPLVSFQKEIDRCILSEDEIADDASPGLYSVRRKLRVTADKVHTELNRMIVSGGQVLRENVITMRNGRYCLPVKNEYRAQVPGMIHDESGSGSTVFIEPMSVVKLNNEIRELEIQEAKEIEKILAALSEEAEAHSGALKTDLQLLSHLDFVFAKGALARDMRASRPVLNDRHEIDLKDARHPLLQEKTVVPISVSLGVDFDTLIVTGPNTGGKTVSLKTVGLLSLMGQSGLHIPASEHSSLGVFTEIFADIGDEQSIEQSLSTFSSHMKNIVAILKVADGNSLVLLDELAAGTDPEEGAALAIAILKALRRRHVLSMTTTHYSELKLFALSEEGVENGSCEFDVATLSPTYKLLIGIPGKSNAFAISRRLGLSEQIVQEAKEEMASDTTAFEDVIKDLHDSKRKLEKEKSKIGQLKAEAKEIKSTLDKEQEKLNEKREKILADAREEARRMLAEAKAEVDEAIRQLNRQGKSSKDLEAVRQKTREALEKTMPEASKEDGDDTRRPLNPASLHIGDGVFVRSMKLKGVVSTLPDARGNLFVQMGILRSQVNLSDLSLLKEDTVTIGGKPSGSVSKLPAGKALTISPEINLIGKTVDEALPELDKYLDDAAMAHLTSIRIVHGKGTGALRKAVHEKLRTTSFIKDFRMGAYGEGDAGVTIATLK